MSLVFGLAIGFGLGYYVGGHPEQVKARTGALVDLVRAKFAKKGP